MLSLPPPLAACAIASSSIALVTICAAVFGIIGTSALKQELFPPLELPQAFVSAEYEGASPEAVELKSPHPLRSITGVEEVESIQSTSSSGSSPRSSSRPTTARTPMMWSVSPRARGVPGPGADAGRSRTVRHSGGLADFPIVMLSVSCPEDVNQLHLDLEDVAIPELNDIEGVAAPPSPATGRCR